MYADGYLAIIPKQLGHICRSVVGVKFSVIIVSEGGYVGFAGNLDRPGSDEHSAIAWAAIT